MKKIIWIVTVLPLIITAAVLQFMPDSVPMHYDIKGEIDRYGSRYELLLIPAVIILLTAFFLGYGRSMLRKGERAANADSNKKLVEAQQNAKVFNIVALLAAVIMGLLQCTFLYKAYVHGQAGMEYLEIDEMKITGILMSVMFIIFGNYMPKAKTNGALGFRMSWTMFNDITWSKSNRYAGICLMIVGVCSFVSSVLFSGITGILLMLGYLTIALIAAICYAHKIYLEEIEKSEK